MGNGRGLAARTLRRNPMADPPWEEVKGRKGKKGRRVWKPLGCFVPTDPEWAPLCPLGVVRKDCVGYRKVQVLVDSGAAASVIPVGLLDDYEVIEGDGKKKGVMYMTADGGEIPNLGEQRVDFKTFEGHDGGH